MLEIEATPFLAAVTELRHLLVLIDQIDKDKRANPIGLDDRVDILAPHTARMVDALAKLGARSAIKSAARLKAKLDNVALQLTYIDVGSALHDIESRFADHLSDIKLFVLNEYEAGLMAPADQLLGTGANQVSGFSAAFPNAALEIEEAGKCFALGRYTASVFHCMRALEIGIKAIGAFLGIPDPTKPAEKNWSVILKAIKTKIDEKWPANARLPRTQGAQMEALYATLDATKNPWRNATMHVEATYYPHESMHIARCTGMFMLELMKHCDEEGRSPKEAPAMAITTDASSSEAGVAK
jgi:hypothetical protein